MNPETIESSPSQSFLTELEQCQDSAAVGEWLAERPALLLSAVVRQLAETVRQEVRVDLDRALRLAEVALAIAGKIDDTEALGLGYRAKANVLWFSGKLMPGFTPPPGAIAIQSPSPPAPIALVAKTASSMEGQYLARAPSTRTPSAAAQSNASWASDRSGGQATRRL